MAGSAVSCCSGALEVGAAQGLLEDPGPKAPRFFGGRRILIMAGARHVHLPISILQQCT